MFYKDTVMSIDNVEVHISKRIDHLRGMRDMTQEDLAKRLGVTQSAVCSWEVGRSRPRRSMIDDICHALRVTRKQFIGLEPVNYLYF